MTTVTSRPQPVPAPTVRQVRRWGLLLGSFAVACLVILALPVPSLGMQVLVLVVGFSVATVAVARHSGDDMLLRAWGILAAMSVLMVLPDWFLADVLGSIRFPDTGAPFIGAIPLFMAGMWTIALMPVVLAGLAATMRWGLAASTLVAVLVGGGILAAAERLAPGIPLWEARDVSVVAGVATYVVIPELVLCAAAFLLVRSSPVMPRWSVILCTVLLPFTYTGMLAVSYQFTGDL